MDIKKEVINQFGNNADSYVDSKGHAKGNDLKMMVEHSGVDHNSILLDVATGGGHTANAFAPLVNKVIAYDLTPKMLEAAKKFIISNGHKNVEFVQGDAENLSFSNETFDFVTCRIAAHHFPSLKQFIKETYRVLKNNGCFLLIDNVAPEIKELDKFYNDIEKQRDQSHYRAWKKSEWIKFLEEEKFTIESMFRFEKKFNFVEWCERMKLNISEMRDLEKKISNSSPEIMTHFNIEIENNRVNSFTGESVLIKAKKL